MAVSFTATVRLRGDGVELVPCGIVLLRDWVAWLAGDVCACERCGRVYQAKAQAQAVADASALAGASQTPPVNGRLPRHLFRQECQAG